MGFLSVVQNTSASEAREGTTMAARSWVADSEQSWGSKALILRSQYSQFSGLRASTATLTALSSVGVTKSPLCSQSSNPDGVRRPLPRSHRSHFDRFHGVDTAFLMLLNVGVTVAMLPSQRSRLPGFRRGTCCVRSTLNSLGVTGPSLRSQRSRITDMHLRGSTCGP